MLLQFGVSVCTTTQACVFGTKQSLCILSCVHKQGHQKTLKKLPHVYAHFHVTSHDQRFKVQSALRMSSTIYINNLYICGGE